MTLERAGRWWPGREMAMLRREAEAERWQRMTYDEKVAEQAAARRASRRWSIEHNAAYYKRMFEQEEEVRGGSSACSGSAWRPARKSPRGNSRRSSSRSGGRSGSAGGRVSEDGQGGRFVLRSSAVRPPKRRSWAVVGGRDNERRRRKGRREAAIHAHARARLARGGRAAQDSQAEVSAPAIARREEAVAEAYRGENSSRRRRAEAMGRSGAAGNGGAAACHEAGTGQGTFAAGGEGGQDGRVRREATRKGYV